MGKFGLEENGYKKEEVNNYLADIVIKVNTLISQNKIQELEIKKLKNELEYYKNIEEKYNSIIYDENKDVKVTETAKEESQIIIDNAKYNASRIVNEALLKANSIEEKTITLEKNITIYKDRLKKIVSQQESIINHIEIIDLD